MGQVTKRKILFGSSVSQNTLSTVFHQKQTYDWKDQPPFNYVYMLVYNIPSWILTQTATHNQNVILKSYLKKPIIWMAAFTRTIFPTAPSTAVQLVFLKAESVTRHFSIDDRLIWTLKSAMWESHQNQKRHIVQHRMEKGAVEDSPRLMLPLAQPHADCLLNLNTGQSSVTHLVTNCWKMWLRKL